MREILFKGKRTDNQGWVEGSLLQYRNGKNVIICTQDWKPYGVEVDPSTVCQHIGLTDKRGKKSFESDKIYDPHENRVFTIYWDKETASFCLRDDNGWMKKDISRVPYCEIIGNIYDKEE